MAFDTLLLAIAASVPTLGEVMKLPPAEAGAAVWRGHDHLPIEFIEKERPTPLTPPMERDVYLIERAALADGGCTRKRWIARFRAAPTEPRDSGKLAEIASGLEIQLARAGTCPSGQFVSLPREIEPGYAFKVLATLDLIRSGKAKAHFTCTDSTRTQLCSGNRKIARELGRNTPWAMRKQDNLVEFWLRDGSGVLTEVKFDPANPRRVEVNRLIPPPP